jgi:hypothetical protein
MDDFGERMMAEFRQIALQISEANDIIRLLQPRLDKLTGMIQAYGLDAKLDKIKAGDDIKAGGEAVKSKGEIIAVAAAELLREGSNRWTKTSEIHWHLVNKGISIGGKNPHATLSAHLSNSKIFNSDRIKGWQLRPEHVDQK